MTGDRFKRAYSTASREVIGAARAVIAPASPFRSPARIGYTASHNGRADGCQSIRPAFCANPAAWPRRCCRSENVCGFRVSPPKGRNFDRRTHTNRNRLANPFAVSVAVRQRCSSLRGDVADQADVGVGRLHGGVLRQRLHDGKAVPQLPQIHARGVALALRLLQHAGELRLAEHHALVGFTFVFELLVRVPYLIQQPLGAADATHVPVAEPILVQRLEQRLHPSVGGPLPAIAGGPHQRGE